MRSVPGAGESVAVGQRFLFVYEFPPGDAEWQLRDLAAGLVAQEPTLRISYCVGFLAHYVPGGLSGVRLLNAAWTHLRASGQILFGNYDAVMVRSAPPLIQFTVAAACAARGIPYWFWLMDAHPEIESELWAKRPVVGTIARGLARLNRSCIRHAELVIVLDEGMRQRLVSAGDERQVIVCPTWGRRQSPIQR